MSGTTSPTPSSAPSPTIETIYAAVDADSDTATELDPRADADVVNPRMDT